MFMLLPSRCLTVIWCALATCVLVRADYVAATVTTGLGLRQVAVNPVTNKIYTANYGSSSVTVIDGATNATLTVGVGANPYLLAVNPVTNKIYVVNLSNSFTESSFVTVIDGATNASSTVGVGVDPQAIGVNTVTNRIYVADYESNTVTVIDGATNSTTTVNVGTQPIALAVNEVTNKIYTANYGSNSVTAIDGATNATTSISAGNGPYSIAVNPVTNKIYVVNVGDNDVMQIDGVTYRIYTVFVYEAQSVVVNSVTNKLYVNGYAVIDAANGAISFLDSGYALASSAAAVNPVTSKFYAANDGSSDANFLGVFVTVADGDTNAAVTLNSAWIPYCCNDSVQSIAVNPVTNKIYVTNLPDNTVSVIDGNAGNGVLSTQIIGDSVVTYYLGSKSAPEADIWGLVSPYRFVGGQVTGAGSFGAAPPISPLSPSSFVTGTNNINGEQEQLYLTDVDGQQHIEHLWYWSNGIDLNAETPGSVAAAAGSSLAPINDTCAGTYDVFYIGADQLVHAIYWNGALLSDTSISSASVPVRGGNLIGHTKGGSKEVFYFGADGHVHQIWGYSGCPGGPAFDGWHGVDITGAAAGAPSAAAGSPLVGFYNPASLDYVFYVDTNQNLQELSQGEAWRNQDVASNAAGAVAAHQNGTLDEVAFIDSNENLQLYTSPSTTPNAWSSQGALGGVVTAQGSPLATDVLGGLDEYYHIGFGNTVYSVYRLQFSGGSWTVTNMNTTYDGAIQSPSPIP